MQYSRLIMFFTFVCLLSFASTNAVLFTAALPDIADYFRITDEVAQQTISWFLPAYAIGQLIYGPLARRYGRKPALYIGIILQIFSNLLCVFAGTIDNWWVLIIGRTLMGLGSGVGLTLTFTMINELCEPKEASKKMAYLMIAFAVMPGIAIAIGGYLNHLYGWSSCFYAGAFYGLIVFLLVTRLPETAKTLDLNGLKMSILIPAYQAIFRNKRLVIAGLLMGSCTSFIYAFAAVAPFISINLHNMSSVRFGLDSLIPPMGMVLGLIVSAQLSQRYSLAQVIKTGFCITFISMGFNIGLIWLQLPLLFSLFLPMFWIIFGLSLVMPNASALAMSICEDKAHGSAVMSFINMGSTTLVLALMSFFPVTNMLLPMVFLMLWFFMIFCFWRLER